MSYVELAQRWTQHVFEGKLLTGIIYDAVYMRVIPPTPLHAGQEQSAVVRVLLERTNGMPMGDVAWLADDRRVLLQHYDCIPFCRPQVQDLLTFDGQQYTVVAFQESAPGVLWELQVRPSE